MTSQDQPSIDLFVIGAMKAATTGMCDWLDRHPAVAVSKPKEPSLFVTDAAADRWRGRAPELFPGARTDQVWVDGSTDYAKYPAISGVPERVSRHAPGAHLVYLMRHPIARCLSQQRFEWYLGGDQLGFDEAVHARPQMVDNSRYGFQLRQWLDWFAPESFTLVFTEAFAHDPAAQVGRVLSSVGVDPGLLDQPGEARSNETSQLVRRPRWRRRLRRSPVGQLLRPLVPSSSVDRYRRRQEERSTPVMSESTRRRLEATFDEDLASLQPLVGGPDLTCANWDDVVPRWNPVLNSA